MSRTSATIAATRAQAEEEGVPVRYSSVPCALRKVLHASMLPLIEPFERIARSQGLYRHVVSIIANEIAIETPLAIGADIFQFYGRLYSAMDRYVRCEIAKRCNTPKTNANKVGYYDAEVARFFERHPMDGNALNVLEYQSLVLVRQQECNAMATAAHEMIEMFPQRLRRFVNAKVVQIAIQMDTPMPKSYELSKTATCITDAILSPNGKIKAFPEGMSQRMRAALESLVRSERLALGDVADVKKALRNKKRHYEILPHLRRISDASLALLREFDLLPQEHVMVDNEFQDGTECLPCDEESDDEQDKQATDPVKRIWTRNRRPKSFALLPIAKLQRSMAYYGWTELKALFKALSVQHRRQERERKPSQRTKRKRDESPEEECKEPPVDLYPEPHAVTFGRELFNFEKLKGKSSILRNNPKSWELSGFRTDGIRAVLTFVSGRSTAQGAPHVEALVESGYQIPRPSDPVDPSTERGLFRITQTRNDAAFSDAWDTVEFVACDPGFCRPVQFASCHGTLQRTATQLAEEATPQHVDALTWMTESGRQSRLEIEKLLKQMAVRGLTFLLDECNTSKCCPCGQDELVDSSSLHTEARERVRVHKTDGGTCGVLHRCRDRDALATLNMLQAAVAAVRHESWPRHLLRQR